MSKKKIADSIIIRVGGGIREVQRKPVENAEILEAVHDEPGFDQTEDVHPFGGESGAVTKISSDKIIN